MREEERATYLVALNAAAARLAQDGKLPVDVNAVCDSLRIPVTFGSIPGKAKAGVMRGSAGIEIRLRSEPGKVVHSALTRFLIAHELGHILLERQYSVVPMGKSEYWQHEVLCDAFAGALLVPDDLIKRKFSSQPNRPTDFLASVFELALFAGVPWRVAASRVSALFPELALFKAKLMRRNQRQHDHFRIVVSSLPNKQGINTRINSETKLSSLLFRLVEKRQTASVDRVFFEELNLPVWHGVTEGAISSDGRGEFRILVKVAERTAHV